MALTVSASSRAVLVGATLFGGALAGPAAIRVLVHLPAWRETGVVAWADFTRAADLGAGRIVYPAIGLTALLFAVAAAISYRFDRTLPRAGAALAYAAAVLAIAALIVTGRLLAPVTLSLVHMPDDPARLGPLFDSVVQWWDVKALLHTLAFVANVWSLAALWLASDHSARRVTA
jgi:hypothetical protein